MSSVLNHEKTWLVWINQLSPISPTISNVSLEDRVALAGALALASPGGPSGVECVDTCRCHDQVPARASLELWTALLDRGHLTNVPADEIVSKLRYAIKLDLIASDPRAAFPALALAEAGVMVSTRNAEAIAARAVFPRTWQMVERLLGR